MSNKPKVLFFDLETIAKPFTTGDRLRSEDTAVVTFGYAFNDEKVKALDLSDNPKDFAKDPFNDKKLLEAAAKIILDSDFIVAHYGSGFDKPMLRTRFILAGLDEAAVHLGRMKVIDTCIMARNILRVRSSSLRYLLELFGLGSKGSPGNECWVGVMRSDKKAMQAMTKYCINDVAKLRKLYYKLRTFAPNHPNLNFEKKDACPVCLSTWLVIKTKPILQGKTAFKRVKCRKCGSESRGGKVGK